MLSREMTVQELEGHQTGWPPIFVIENPVYSSTFWSIFAAFQVYRLQFSST